MFGSQPTYAEKPKYMSAGRLFTSERKYLSVKTSTPTVNTPSTKPARPWETQGIKDTSADFAKIMDFTKSMAAPASAFGANAAKPAEATTLNGITFSFPAPSGGFSFGAKASSPAARTCRRAKRSAASGTKSGTKASNGQGSTATSAPAAPASFGDFGAAASNGFMDKANRMFGCGRMFQSPPTFNEKPKFMSPGPKFGFGAAASNADRMLGAQGSLKHAPMEPTAPSVGARVKLHSLQKNPEHNGVEGEVVEPLHPVSGRWGVKIDSDGRVLALKPANLVLIRKHAQMVPAS